MVQSCQIEFKILVGDKEDDWTLIDQLLGESPYLLDYYLSVDGLHCCDFQGGFFIDIDGKPWSDDGCVDEFWMTMTWFQALEEILDGQETAQAHPWEESHLTLTRQGDELTLEDIHYSGQVAMPLVKVSLYAFVEQIIATSAKFARLVDELNDEMKARRANGVSAATEAKLQEIERNLPHDIDREIQVLTTRLNATTRQ